MIVADASTILELLLGSRRGRAVELRLRLDGDQIHAPSLLDLEVAHAFRRLVRRGVLSADRASRSIKLLEELGVKRHTHEPLLKRVWALRDNVTAYDAAYVALAEALRAPLLTCDQRLAAAPGITASIELVQ